MKKLLLSFSIFFVVGLINLYAVENNDNELQDRSVLDDQLVNPGQTTYPFPFVKQGANPRTSPAISTGYYFVDSREIRIPTFWRPSPRLVSLDFEPNLWKKIISGPRQVDSTYWDAPENSALGLGFFRNPTFPSEGSYFMHDVDPTDIRYATDSTNEAFAGPIPIGISGGFYFNGIRYDSFYVSTNGVIALTNRRYFYDSEGQVTIPPGATTAYDPMSMDWFANGRSRTSAPTGLEANRLPDDFGYQYAVLGNTLTNRLGGIRNPLYNYTMPSNPSTPANHTSSAPNGLSGFEVNNKAALIAPFWGPLAMNTYNVRLRRPIDFSQVWYKRNITSDKLIIYYKDITVQFGNFNNRFANNQFSLAMPYNPEFGLDENAVYASAQVVLDRNDSSITFQYGRFQGSGFLTGPGWGTFIPANLIFQRLTVSGVRGFARHVNYDGVNAGAPVEYEQLTHFNNAVDVTARTIYASDLAIKFQQYKNVLRMYDVQYRVRGQEKTSNLDFVTVIPQNQIDNYELLAGEEKIGALQPIISIQNLTNDIQGTDGVNFTRQGLLFRSRIKIINEVSNEIVYSSLVDINHPNLMGASDNTFISVKYSDANGNPQDYPPSEGYTGIPPYGFAKIIYRAFEPSEFDNKYIGRLKIYINCEPTNPTTNERYGDEWPFDDTVSFKLWVMKRLNTFKDDVTEFHVLDGITVPSVFKWVNLGVRAVRGEMFSRYPLAPRGNFQDERSRGQWLTSPELYFDNKDEGGQYWNPDQNPNTPDGDELRSFPIDLSNKRNPTLSLSIQRAAYFEGIDYPRGFLDRELIGPEPRVIINDNPNNPYMAVNLAAARWTDNLSVEFAYPSPNGIKNITNIPNNLWKQHQVLTPGGSRVNITNTAALQMYGAGGYTIGFLETNKDSALTSDQGLRADKFDDGFDWDFKKFFIRIPSYILNAADGGARNFRFRLKEWSYEYFQININSGPIPDDDDVFIVDNVAIISQGEDADIEVSSVKVHWPYTAIPASQATRIPVKVIVSNNTAVQSEEYALKTFITKGETDTVYCSITNQPLLREGKTIEVPLPEWNARLSGPGTYRLHTQMFYIGNSTDYRDLDQSNDYNFSEFILRFSDSYVYENSIDTAGARNDVPSFLAATTMPGKGLNLRGYNEGGIGNISNVASKTAYASNDALISGYVGGDGSGEIAVKFEVFDQDTIYGFKAFFGNMSVDQDNIFLRVYNDGGSGLFPGTQIEGSNITRLRGLDDLTGQFSYNSYVTYLLDAPIQLNAGIYWISIVQRGAYGLELGAKADRMGMRTTSLGIRQPTNQNLPLGELGNSLLVDKNLRRTNSVGQLVNNNLFCYQNTSGDGSWNLFMPNTGNPAYAHLDHFGTTPGDGYQSYTFSRGTWLPMLRPYFTEKQFGQPSGSIPCPDPVPVELSEFEGHYRNNNVELYWRTASETSNKGFYVEKAVEGGNFESIAFINGNGTTTSMSEYSYRDSKVENGNTYLYRLKQMDMDASQCAKYSNVVKINVSDNLVSHKVGPNPFNTSTVISVTLPNNADVKLDVLDMLGNEVINLYNDKLPAGNRSFNWNGSDAYNIQMPSASYIYRLNVDGVISYGKVTLAR